MPSTIRFSAIAFGIALLSSISSVTNAFSVAPPASRVVVSPSTTQLSLFGGLKGAFANDEGLGKAENAGLKGGPKYNENVTINGKPVKAVVGQKVSVVAAQARVKIAYNCKNGECGTCQVKMNGRLQKACVQTIPAGKCAINTI